MEKIYTALGLMSGTSLDGVDVSIIESNGINEYCVILDDYFIVDYGLKYDLLNYGKIYMDINNVFKNNYEQAFMYSSMERNINIGIRMVY